jgi:hypothetical protein
MACSLLVWAVSATLATAQTDYRPSTANVYNFTVSPWPTVARSTPGPVSDGFTPQSNTGVKTADAMMQPSATVEPAANWVPVEPPKTVRYKKDARPGQPAAGLASPRTSSESKGRNDEPNGKIEQVQKRDKAALVLPGDNDKSNYVEILPDDIDDSGMKWMFRFDSEKRMLEARKKELAKREKKIDKQVAIRDLVFPTNSLPAIPYIPRCFGPATVFAEPNYVLYGNLLFEDKNAERYGWDLGLIQPLASTEQFFAGMAFLPYKLFSWPFLRYDTGAGLALPGDSVPYMIYPPSASITGTVAETGVVLAIYFAFR